MIEISEHHREKEKLYIKKIIAENKRNKNLHKRIIEKINGVLERTA